VSDHKLPIVNCQLSIDNRQLKRPADCLGVRGLPAVRAELDALVDELCDRLRIVGAKGLRGQQIVAEMNLTGTRALRLLVAYAQVRLGRTEIVGVPGSGYVWGPAAPESRRMMARHAHRMGLDWLRKSSDYGHPAGRQLTLQFSTDEG